MSNNKCNPKKMSAGERHVKLLGIREIKSDNDMFKQCKNRFGNKGLALLEQCHNGRYITNYDIKNSDYEFSMFFSGGYDYNIIIKTCDWIDGHKEYFGNRILEIGCDCGFMTTFLASKFPNSRIISIEREEKSIDIAKKNCQKLNLTNVEFILGDVNDLKDDKIDTVFSMRTMHENLTKEVSEYPSDELIPLSEDFFKNLTAYSSILSSLIKEDGTIISIERTGMNSLFLGWIKALMSSGLNISTKDHKEIVCKEVDKINSFQALVCKKSPSDDDPFGTFITCFKNHINTTLGKYEGWDAKIMFAYTGKRLIEGFIIKDLRTGHSKLTCIVEHYCDDTCIVMYQNNNGFAEITYWDISEKDHFLSELHSQISDYKKISYLEVTKIQQNKWCS